MVAAFLSNTLNFQPEKDDEGRLLQDAKPPTSKEEEIDEEGRTASEEQEEELGAGGGVTVVFFSRGWSLALVVAAQLRLGS
jgi:hypothetical protein